MLFRSLNRMAWAQLKLSSKTGSKKTIEENIIALLEKQIADGKDDSNYKDALESFKKAPLSRRALSEIMPSVLEIMVVQDVDAIENNLFHLSQSDLKMLDLLSAKENASAKSSEKFLTNKNDDRSIMHITKMINSSYRNLDPKLYAKNESFLEAEMKRLMADQENLLEELMALPECELVSDMFCAVVPNERVDFMHELENIMGALYKGTLIKETDYSGLRYGEMWLKVKTKK